MGLNDRSPQLQSMCAQSHVVGEAIERSPDSAEGPLYYQDLLHAIERLHEENDRRHAAIAGAVHDLKTPLAILSGYLNLLVAEKLGTVNEKQMQALKDMVGSCRRLDRSISKLLAFGASTAHQLRLAVEIGDLNECLRRAGRMFSPAFEDKHIHFECRLEDEPLRFAFDRQKIQQIVANLLENALRFTPENGTVSLAARRQFWERRSITTRPPGLERRRRNQSTPNAAFITVADTGPGIAPEYQQEIFEDFFSMGTDSVAQGTGLGLSIARYLVQAHGGKIWVESKPGEGAQFFVMLPFSMSENAARQATAAR